MIIDLISLVLLVLAIFKGFSKGLVVALFSTVSIFVGLLISLKISASVSAYFSGNGEHSKWAPLLTFVIVMVAVVFLVRLGAKAVEKALKILMLGWLNRLGGFLLYFFGYFMLLSIVLYYLGKVGLISEATMHASQTYKYIAPWGPSSVGAIGKMLPWVKDIFSTLNNGFG